MHQNQDTGSHHKRYRWIKWMLVASAGLLVLFVSAVWLIYLPPNGTNINSVDSETNLVALTFDDGPNPPYTDEILAILDQHAIKATFFMTGKYVELHPESAQRVFAAGHEIANHGWDEQTLAFKSRGTIEASIARTDRALSETLGPQYISPPYFRAPQGQQFLVVADVLRSQGRVHIGATRLGNDWLPRYQENPSRIASRVLDGVKGGDIIVLHDGNDHIDSDDRQGTVAATRLIVKGLKDKGLEPVSVGTILSAER